MICQKFLWYCIKLFLKRKRDFFYWEIYSKFFLKLKQISKKKKTRKNSNEIIILQKEKSQQAIDNESIYFVNK